MPTARREESTFRLQYAVDAEIRASPARVWSVLTELAAWPRWNTTITSIEGDATLGQKLKIRVPIAERTFTPQVVALEPGVRMVWSDGAAPMFKGTRTYTLTPSGTGTSFSMEEVFAGVMLPLIKGSLPDFRRPFEQFATDLAAEAERDR